MWQLSEGRRPECSSARALPAVLRVATAVRRARRLVLRPLDALLPDAAGLIFDALLATATAQPAPPRALRLAVIGLLVTE